MKLLLVTWRDACSDNSGWKPLKKIANQKPMRVKSVGWLVKRTPHAPYAGRLDLRRRSLRW